MQASFQDHLNSDFPFLKEGKIYLAISGGKDSMALSYLLRACDLEHTLLHCNFQLRGMESDQDESFLRNYARENEIELKVKEFETERLSEELGTNIQETARNLRYEWFSSFLEKEDCYLLTAHHLDDSIETLFLNILRGTGIKGLGGIPRINGKIIRPLSDFSSEQISSYVKENNISFREDSSNSDDKYRRNNLRMNVIPELKEMESGFQEKMKLLFDDVHSVVEYFEDKAQELRDAEFSQKDDQIIFSVDFLENTNPFLLQFVFSEFGIHRKNLTEFLSISGAEVGARFICGDYVFLRDRDRVILSKSSDDAPFEQLVEDFPSSFVSPLGFVQLRQKEFEGLEKNSTIQQFELEKIILPIKMRRWKNGDKIRPLGLGGSKLISDILIDQKVDSLTKMKQVVIEDGSGHLLALVGRVVSEDYKVTEETQEILEVRIG